MPQSRWLLLAAAVCGCAVVGTTATSTVPASRAGTSTVAATATQLAPPECAALALTNVVTGSGNVNGTGANDLVLGGPGADRLRGRGGVDCLVGGGGNDTLVGNGGSDVCIGGQGSDSFSSCAYGYQ